MCMPKAPAIPTPETPQAIKQPDTAQAMRDSAKRNRAGGMAGGSLLTGPTGVANAAASTGRTTLLGG